MPRAPNKLKADTKRFLIISTAVEIAEEHGLSKVNVRTIARAMGVADGTLYLYFANLRAIHIEVLKALKLSAEIRSELAFHLGFGEPSEASGLESGLEQHASVA